MIDRRWRPIIEINRMLADHFLDVRQKILRDREGPSVDIQNGATEKVTMLLKDQSFRSHKIVNSLACRNMR